jgi:hypothetical protein
LYSTACSWVQAYMSIVRGVSILRKTKDEGLVFYWIIVTVTYN